MKTSDFTSLSYLGCGIGLRRDHFKDLRTTNLPVNFLEVIPENFMNFGGYPQEILQFCAQRWPIVSHGVNLSIGSLDPLNSEYLERLKTMLEQTNAQWFSDHFCFSSVGGEYFHDLLPLPNTHEAVDHVVKRIAQVQQKIKKPFLLENPSYYVVPPGAQMSEPEFFRQILQRSNSGMLLDINNVYVNSLNHNFNARDYIRQLPLERVAQIHMAGHKDCGDVIIDTHEGPIIDPVWQLYRFTIELMQRAVTTLIEWDTNIPSLDKLIEESQMADRIIQSLGLAPKITRPAKTASIQVHEPRRGKISNRKEAVSTK